MLQLVVWLLVVCVVFAVAHWVVNQLLPEPIKRFANIALVIIGAIFIIWLLLSIVGPPNGLPRIRIG